MGQLLSLPMIVVGAIVMMMAYSRHQPSGNYGDKRVAVAA
jgi:prolipoprotein diacylglyceryltransferase